MSNIPMNTVVSILATGNVQRQAAEAIDRNTHTVARSEKVLSLKNQRHAEEVEDPGDYGMGAIKDENRQNGQSQQQDSRHPAAKVDIAGVATPDPDAGAGIPTAKSVGLDISA